MPKTTNQYFYSRANYPNVHMTVGEDWFVRKWSTAKGKELFRKIPGARGKADAAKAYKLGMQMFNAWEGGQNAVEEKGEALTTIADLVRERRVRRLKERKANTISESSFVNAKTSLDKIEAVWGTKKPAAVTADAFKDLYLTAYGEVRAKYAAELEAGRMTEEQVVQEYPRFANFLKELRPIMKRAYGLGLIRELPTFKCPDPDSTRRVYLEPARTWKILDAKVKGAKHLRRLPLWVYLTGMRPYEIEWVEETDFDWAAGTLHIRFPKPGTPPRTIPVPQLLLDEAKAHFEVSKSKYLIPAARAKADEPVPRRYYMKFWRRLCKAAGEGKRLDIYSLRHSFLTDMADAGVNVIWLAKYCGTSVEMLDGVYYKARAEKLAAIPALQDNRIIRGSFEGEAKTRGDGA